MGYSSECSRYVGDIEPGPSTAYCHGFQPALAPYKPLFHHHVGAGRLRADIEFPTILDLEGLDLEDLVHQFVTLVHTTVSKGAFCCPQDFHLSALSSLVQRHQAFVISRSISGTHVHHTLSGGHGTRAGWVPIDVLLWPYGERPPGKDDVSQSSNGETADEMER